MGTSRKIVSGWRLAVKVMRWFMSQRRLPTSSEIHKGLGRLEGKIPGVRRFRRFLYHGVLDGVVEKSPYDSWLEVNAFNPRRELVLRSRFEQVEKTLCLGVVLPCYNSDPGFLSLTLRSVLTQIYPNWRLIVVDDGSTKKDHFDVIEKSVAESNGRIQFVPLSKNGNISHATNVAVEKCATEFVVFLDHDDLLSPDALGEIAAALSENPGVDFIYSDDDKVDVRGIRYDAQFKPDWSPELLLSYMYVGHIKCVRRSIYQELGGFRVGFEGSQDYDFMLRLAERTEKIFHIPKVLYHWRAVPGSTAAGGNEKPSSLERGRLAVQEALVRRKVIANAIHPDWAARIACGFFEIRFPDAGPSVTLLIPTKNNPEILERCLDSLKKTTYQNYRVLILDNENDNPESLRIIRESGHESIVISSPNGKFNYANLNNRGVEKTTTDFVLFLNDDTEVIEPGWLSQMMGYAQLPGVGAVGAKLLFPDKTIQHAGIVHGYYGGLAGPAFRNKSWADLGYLGYLGVSRNYSAVTAACLLVSKANFQACGGFDEKTFAVAFNDVDLCYRLIERGLRHVFCASAVLFHHENKTRSKVDNPRETIAFRKKYAGFNDRYYNPNLTLEDETFRIQSSVPVEVNPTNLRVVYYSYNLNHEGSANSLFEMVKGLKARGRILPTVVAPHDGPLRARYEALGIPVRVVDIRLDASHYGDSVTRLGDVYRELGAEVAHVNTLPNFYAVEAAHVCGIPSIWNPRESEPWDTYFQQFGKFASGRAYQVFQIPYKIVFVSYTTARNWAPANTRNNFHVIQNGLDRDLFYKRLQTYDRNEVRRELKIGDDEVVFLILGTVCDRKGQIDLVKAFQHLTSDEARKSKILIVGDRAGDYSEKMHALVDKFPTEKRDRVHIIPETSEIGKYYRCADVFVACSRIESFPRVILEAMCAELPIITTPVFGVHEQCVEGLNAYFYEPGDDKELSRQMSLLLQNPGQRQNMGEMGKVLIDRINTYSEMLEKYEKVVFEAYYANRSRVVTMGQ